MYKMSRLILTDPDHTLLDDIAAFGDDKNDMDMLRLCGREIAVANAIPELLGIADEVTLSNDEDGVAKWIEQNL